MYYAIYAFAWASRKASPRIYDQIQTINIFSVDLRFQRKTFYLRVPLYMLHEALVDGLSSHCVLLYVRASMLAVNAFAGVCVLRNGGAGETVVWIKVFPQTTVCFLRLSRGKTVQLHCTSSSLASCVCTVRCALCRLETSDLSTNLPFIQADTWIRITC